MPEEKNCTICGKPFLANKYRPNQVICSSLECQYQRQLNNMKSWRGKNPNYFRYREARDTSWKETCKQRSLDWRKRHEEYLKLYREEHRERHRNYMRDYMREYRKKNKSTDNKENEIPSS
ncbi:MAG: hypothetical protein A2987_02675 [Omnitrophica bacterium RIFCSPLOWO2_01_FULL_45_10]|nr:MAG: hypothetical protein A2987_02675 [Omnitrophica bacterium RIFCSPLOWO2_01_FULL_45_10]